MSRYEDSAATGSAGRALSGDTAAMEADLKRDAKAIIERIVHLRDSL